jgi:hypothetical protein
MLATKETFIDDGSLETAVQEIEEQADFVGEQVRILIAENVRLWGKAYKLGAYAARLRAELKKERKC